MYKEYETAREIVIDLELGYITKKQAIQLAHLNGLDIMKMIE